MKKILSVSLMTAALLVSGTSLVGAEEAAPKWKQTPEFQALKELLEEKKQVSEQLQAQRVVNQELWQSLKGAVTPEVRERVKQVVAEVKPLRQANKDLVAQLKQAKANKEKEKVQALKAQIEANHQTIEQKLAPIQSELAQVKALHQTLKEPLAQIKPIRAEKKANREKAKQLQSEWKETAKQVKEARASGNEAEVKALLDEAADTLQQLVDLKLEILSQKAQIADLLKQAQ